MPILQIQEADILLRPRGQRWDKLGTTPRFFVLLWYHAILLWRCKNAWTIAAWILMNERLSTSLGDCVLRRKGLERMRALEWLAARLERKNSEEDAVLRKLDEVLAELRK